MSQGSTGDTRQLRSPQKRLLNVSNDFNSYQPGKSWNKIFSLAFSPPGAPGSRDSWGLGWGEAPGIQKNTALDNQVIALYSSPSWTGLRCWSHVRASPGPSNMVCPSLKESQQWLQKGSISPPYPDLTQKLHPWAGRHLPLGSAWLYGSCVSGCYRRSHPLWPQTLFGPNLWVLAFIPKESNPRISTWKQTIWWPSQRSSRWAQAHFSTDRV